MSERPGLQYWWVNHQWSATRATRGSQDWLWAPVRHRKGSNSESFRNITRVRPGDLVFAYADGALRGLGLALLPAFETPETAAARQSTQRPGWQLPLRLFEFAVPLDPKPNMAQLGPLLPARCSPLRATGVRNPAVFLASITDGMAAVLRRLLAGQVEEVESQLKATVGSELADDWIETTIRHRRDISAEDKQQLIRARRGLGVFRSNLERIEHACRVTGLLDRRHLRACHIKPWSACEDREKIDGSNGLLLSPHIAHLFVRGYISFSDEGQLLFPRHLNPAVLSAWKLPPSNNVGAFTPRQRVYLDYHRRTIFDQAEIGRCAAL